MLRHAERLRGEGKVALVPTMGAIHEGHLALIRKAQDQADRVIASIFVNPTQFGPGEDYDAYPRPFEEDARILRDEGVDIIFAPSREGMYPHGDQTHVRVSGLDEHLCGAHRPGHFQGVTTIVSKLLHLCRPHVAVFGRKDAQQLVVLRRMAADLFMGVEILGAPIVREPDGLALSSRNAYLSPEERQQAPVLFEAVTAARRAILQGEQAGNALVETMQKIVARAPEARLQYAEVVDAHSLQPVDHIRPKQDILAALAVFFGKTRLIDNTFIEASER